MGFVPEDRRAEGLAMESSVERNMMLSTLAKAGLHSFTRGALRPADVSETGHAGQQQPEGDRAEAIPDDERYDEQ